MCRAMQVLQILSALILCQINNISGFGPGMKTWNFEFISVGSNSSNENLVKIDLSLERISRGVYGLSGIIAVFGDVEEGDDTMIEARVYRSATGSSEYKLTPFTVKKQHLFDFFNSFYKSLLMKSFDGCSDLPQFEDKFQPPFEKKTYTLKSCEVSNEGMPEHMLEGYYKVDVIGSGRADWVVEAIVKVEKDL